MPLFLRSPIVLLGWFLCIISLSTRAGAACVDSDGDGWGWDGVGSCIVGNSAVATPQSGAGEPVTGGPGSGSCVDPDGDGWGWDGVASCRVSQMPVVQPQSAGSEPQATECIDPDGDGWGWNGVSSCVAGNRVDQQANQPVTSSGAISGESSTAPAGIAQAPGTLQIPAAVCEVAQGESRCTIKVSFNAAGTGPHCLFEKSQASQAAATLLTCGNPTKYRVSIAADQAKTLELRSGSIEYSNSNLLETRAIAGIKAVSRSAVQLSDTRRSTVLKNNSASALATSWDSRLLFDVVGAGNGKRVAVVRVLRAERLSGQSVSALESPDLFSGNYVLASDAMSNAEISRSNLPGKVGVNEIGISIPFNIAVYPNNRYQTNPFRSNAQGDIDDFGQYETYRFYVVMGSQRTDGVSSEYDLIPGNAARGKKIFLTRFEASVVVKNARTANAQVHNVLVHSRAQALRDTQGRLIYGYEPSATLDGRLIVYSGNSNPAVRSGHGGEVNYIYHPDQHAVQGWSAPANVADMYYQHGPGSASGETSVGSLRFSDRFPFASSPLRQYNGELLGAGGVVQGAYPWVSLRGTEVFFMSKSTFHGGNRSGATMAGLRTGGQLWHLDGDINNARGNPTDAYNHFASGNGGQYKAIVNAYEARKYAGTNVTMGKNTWNNVFFRPAGQYPTSWSAVAGTANTPLPVNPFPQSYGFWLTGNRYYEVPFPLYPKDLIAFYPMNEPLLHDQSLLQAWSRSGAGAPSAEQNRRESTRHITDKTADLSSFQHTGVLQNGAQYPFEHYNVKQLWSSRRILKDQSEGAVGNSIFFPRAASVVSRINARAMQPVAQNNAVAVALWFNANALGQETQLLRLGNLLNLSVQQGKVIVEVNNDGSRSNFQANANISSNQWHHVAATWSLGVLKIYVDGVLAGSTDGDGELLVPAGSDTSLVIGPDGNGAGSLLMKIDDVHLYASTLSDADIETLAWRKRNISHSGNSFFSRSGMAADYPDVSPVVDLRFNGGSAEISVGEKLFNSKALSRDNSISCASCHQASRGFSDGQQLASGINAKVGVTNTPAIANMLLSDLYFYSGGAGSLEVQSIHTIMQNGEMGVADAAQMVSALPESLRSELRSVYNTEPGISEVARATAAFVRTIRITGNSHLNDNNLTASAQRGKRLFNGRANCIACHSGSNFTDNAFHDVGVVSSSTGRGAVTDRRSDQKAQKTPTLRNIALTAPYFHNGSSADLAEVVRHYNEKSHRVSGARTDSLLHPLELTGTDINDIVEYLHALTGDVRSGH